MEATDRLGAQAGELVVAFGKHAQHLGIVFGSYPGQSGLTNAAIATERASLGSFLSVRYDSSATDETGIERTYHIDLEASAYAIRQWDLVDQDTPKQTKALEAIANTVKDLAAGFAASKR
jgi:hypothetical protein